jgi:hypothetical protein
MLLDPDQPPAALWGVDTAPTEPQVSALVGVAMPDADRVQEPASSAVLAADRLS